ncbi:type II toxin-antitoxin system VapC family toxin [Rhizobium sp. 0TCS1.26]|uniref:type II toxin-antitoxin system VapC family toxin n=1 Tax=Rhizobium sp. 0TCS1.26 TaxID=3142623 RepID=UPI003D2E182F
MKGWLLDTKVIAALINTNGAPSVKRWAKDQQEASFFISVLSLAEYDKGIENLPQEDDNRHRYRVARDALEERFAGRILSVTDPVVRTWGRIAGRVRQATSHAPPVIDTLMAASAIENDLYLVTRNVKDVSLSGAAVFDPWQDDPERFPLSRR